MNEYEIGQEDCKNGAPHDGEASEEYTLGYAAQYEKEQIFSRDEVN